MTGPISRGAGTNMSSPCGRGPPSWLVISAGAPSSGPTASASGGSSTTSAVNTLGSYVSSGRGMLTTLPHAGHLPCLPANSSRTCSFFPHGQVNVTTVALASCVSSSGSAFDGTLSPGLRQEVGDLQVKGPSLQVRIVQLPAFHLEDSENILPLLLRGLVAQAIPRQLEEHDVFR